jgi:hypothetical protein
MSDRPDYTLPVSVEAYTITSLPVDIVAQTVGIIAIDIAAQSVGDIAVKIAASTVTLNVAIQSSAVTLNVAIQSSAVTLNVNVSSVSGGVTFTVVNAAGGHLDVDIAAQSVGNVGVDIKAQTLGTVAISINSANITGNVPIDIKAQTMGNVSVNIAASAVTLQVNIASQTSNLNVNLAASAITLNINVTSQSAPININTSGGTNIVIDKLTQSAYTERRVTIANGGDGGTSDPFTGNQRHGKFFPRGCRGFINTIDAYCFDTGTAGGTITIFISPCPGIGYLYSADITVPASATAAWRSATFNVPWAYDSLFIFAVESNTYVRVGYTATPPFDYWTSTDAGATWKAEEVTPGFRAVLKAQNIGDIPVSGTVNTIQIPNVAAVQTITGQSCPNNAETQIFSQAGAGELHYLRLDIQYASFATGAADAKVNIYVDGALVWQWGFGDLAYFYENGGAAGFTYAAANAKAYPFALGINMSDGYSRMVITHRFPFQRSLAVKVNNTTGAARNVNCWATINVLK